MRRIEEIQIRVKRCQMAVYAPGATYGPRTLHDHEFVWVLQGQVQWETEGKLVAAGPGSVLLGRPGTREFYRWDPLRQTRHAYFHFDLHLGRAEIAPPDQWPLAQVMPPGDVIRPLFRHLAWLEEARPSGWEILAQGAARQLFLAFITGAFATAEENSVALPPPVEAALRFVQGRWAAGTLASPTLSALARAAGVSEGYLCRLFKKAIGCGPMEALRVMRLERGAMLLARTTLQVQEIADRVGFPNAFHFSRCFAELYGLSPRAYRTHQAAAASWPKSRMAVVEALAGHLWPADSKVNFR